VFFVGKIVAAILAPLNLLCFLMLLASFWTSSFSKEARKRGATLFEFLTFVVVLLTFLPVGSWLLVPLENAYPARFPDKVDGIVMLAGNENPNLTEARGQPVLGTIQRYVLFKNLATRFPEASLVYSGGNPWGSGQGNAFVAKKVFADLGMPTDKIVFEDVSRTTYENASEAARLLQPKPEQNWILITSAYHMPRAIQSFAHAGFNLYAAPVDYRTSGKTGFSLNPDLFGHIAGLSIALHEYAGLLAYRAMGRISTLWPD
jgi:uncharacterized SAM-binding protein YcdF (DUF218 family)